MAKIATKVVSLENMSVTIAFTDGTNMEFRLSDLDTDMRHRLMLHGLSQKLGDKYSGIKSVEAAKAATMEVWNGLKRKIWQTKVAGGILAEALAKVTGKDLAEAVEILSAMGEKEKKGLRANPKIKLAIKTIEYEKVRAEAVGTGEDDDAEDLLALFPGDDGDTE